MWFLKIGEVGELSEIFQWKGEVQRGLPDFKEEEKVHLGEELSDVLLYLVRLSDICGVDLGKAALRKVELNAIKYPAKASKEVTNKEDGIENSTSANNGTDWKGLIILVKLKGCSWIKCWYNGLYAIALKLVLGTFVFATNFGTVTPLLIWDMVNSLLSILMIFKFWGNSRRIIRNEDFLSFIYMLQVDMGLSWPVKPINSNLIKMFRLVWAVGLVLVK